MPSNTPEHIGRFRILTTLGQGGMGTLFLAHDPVLDRRVAVKVLREDHPDLRLRFAREARAAARLRHPNIPAVFEVGEHQGQPFIAMEYVQGQTLAALIASRTPLPLATRLRVVEELCAGLGVAHRAGIVHRDIKPSNVMLDPEGVVKVLDFGIARAIGGDGPTVMTLTKPGGLVGTLNYMSPEQLNGVEADARSDLFAVGAVLYELLAYRQAFSGSAPAVVLNAIAHREPAPLADLVPDLDPRILSIVDRALAKDPAARYQDAEAMRHDLAAARLAVASGAEPTALIPPFADATTVVLPPPRRRASRAGIFAVASIVLLLGLTVGWWMIRPAGTPPAADRPDATGIEPPRPVPLPPPDPPPPTREPTAEPKRDVRPGRPTAPPTGGSDGRSRPDPASGAGGSPSGRGTVPVPPTGPPTSVQPTEDVNAREAIRRALDDARRAAREAQRAADEAGEAARTSRQYGDARERLQEAERLAALDDPADWMRAVRAYQEARDLFHQAAEQARAKATAQPAPATVDPRTEIRAVLAEYERALESLKADRVRQVFPRVDVVSLEQAFANYVENEVTLQDVQIVDLTDNRAIVRCVLREDIRVRQIGRKPSSQRIELVMVRDNGRWVIGERRVREP